MAEAVALSAYAVTVAWCLPAPLARLTGPGTGARLGIAAWLVALASVLAAAGLALEFLMRVLRASWPQLTQAVCREMAGNACTPLVYRSALYSLGVAVATVVAALAAVVAAWRYGRRVQGARRQTLAHGRAARIVGRALPGTGAVLIEDPRPAAYCAAGTIVVTSGALGVLDGAQLAAVLAHERAHLAGRHHAITLIARGLAAAFPGVPLFGRAPGEVARLLEMSADDAAVRRTSRPVLVSALVAIATGEPAPGRGLAPRTGLAAAAYAVQSRVERMLTPPGRTRALVYAAALTAVTVVLAALPMAILSLAP